MATDPLSDLQRWEDAGGTWRVLSRSANGVVLSLRRCDGGEEVDRITSDNPQLLEYLGTRRSNEE
jgi:hypothetical protein